MLSLGLRFPGFSAYISQGGLAWLYDHNVAFAKQEEEEQLIARRGVAEAVLGLNQEQSDAIPDDQLQEMLAAKVKVEIGGMLGFLDDEPKDNKEGMN